MKTPPTTHFFSREKKIAELWLGNDAAPTIFAGPCAIRLSLSHLFRSLQNNLIDSSSIQWRPFKIILPTFSLTSPRRYTASDLTLMECRQKNVTHDGTLLIK